MNRPRRTLALIGARADFTRAVLSGLLARGVRPLVLLLYTPAPATGALPVETWHAVDSLAAANAVPVRGVANGARALDAFLGSGADLGLVACFPGRLPVEEAAARRDDLFNLHPSPLPAYRGPTPLFWQFRAGATATAVSLHRVAPRFDTGAVIGSAPLALAPGATFAVTNERLAALGAELAVDRLLGDAVIGRGERQDSARASYQPFPDGHAFDLDPRWPAERLFRFVAATAAPGRRYRLVDGDTVHHVEQVHAFEPHAVQGRAVQAAGDGRVTIRCRPGVVVATAR